MAHNNPTPGQPQVQYPAPMVFYASPMGNYQPTVIKNFGPHYERQSSIGLGATQIVLACISIIVGGIAFEYQAALYYLGVGIWAGAWYLVAGSLAIAAGKDPTNNLIIATLYFSVSDILIGVTQVTSATIGLIEDLDCYNFGSSYCYYASEHIEANSMNIGVGFLEIIFGIWMTVISARAIDNGTKAQMPYAIPVTFATTQPGTVPMQAPPAVQPEPESHYEQLHFPSTHKDDRSWSTPDIVDAQL